MQHAAARTLSILGHPLAVLPAGLLLPVLRDSGGRPALAVLAGFAGFALLVMAWSRRQVRHGRWAHVDASGLDERRALNRFLLPAILSGAALAWLASAPALTVRALALSAGIVLAAMLLSRWCKLSLHVAFATLAAGLLLPMGWGAVAIGAAGAAAIAWSRLRLARHAPVDLVAGAVAGTLAAVMAWSPAPGAGA